MTPKDLNSLAPKDDRKLGTLLAELVPPEHRGDDLTFEIDGDYPTLPDFDDLGWRETNR